MRLGILFALTFGFSAIAAPTTAPSTAPSVDPAAAYRSATALIKQGKLPEAQALLVQADRSYKGVKIDSQRADILYASGVCYMLQGEYQKAHQAFERIRSARNKDREFILNDAKVDLSIKNLITTAVRPLDNYLASTSTPDEEAIDLFGAAIDKASQNGMTAAGIAAPADHYVAYNAKLEATKPGMHHWGQRWMTDAEFADIETQRKHAQKAVDNAKDQVRFAQDELNHAQANYNEEQTRIQNDQLRDQYSRNYNGRYYRDSRTVNPNPVPARTNVYQSSVESATATLKQRQQELRDAQTRFPKPSFTANLQPILPESWGMDQPAPTAAKDADPAAASAAAPALADLLQKMVDEVGPAPGAAWTKLNTDLAQKWLQTNAAAKPLLVTANYASGTLRPDGAIQVLCNVEQFTIGKMTIAGVKVTALLPDTEAAKAAKLVTGKPMKASGKVQSIVLATPKTDPGNVQIELQMTDTTLAP